MTREETEFLISKASKNALVDALVPYLARSALTLERLPKPELARLAGVVLDGRHRDAFAQALEDEVRTEQGRKKVRIVRART